MTFVVFGVGLEDRGGPAAVDRQGGGCLPQALEPCGRLDSSLGSRTTQRSARED